MQPQPVQQQIKTYRTGLFAYAEKKFTKDAARLAREGWRVSSQSASGYRWFTRRADVITVVYVR
jgi:hypothetical protein